MATYTTNLNLEKPAGSENYNISVQNSNMDIIDGAISNNVFPVQVGTKYSSAIDFNTITAPGVYTLSNNSAAQGSSNSPSVYAGRLCVWSLNGNDMGDNTTYSYGGQIYYNTQGSQYARSFANEAGTKTWGTWKTISMT